MLGAVGLLRRLCIDAPKVGCFPGKEGGREKGAATFNGDSGPDWPGRDEFAVAGDEPIGRGCLLFPEGFSGQGVCTVDVAIIGSEPCFFSDEGGREADGGICKVLPFFFTG